MIINKVKYELPLNNYIQEVFHKKFVVFGNTFNSNMRHYHGWLHRYNGNYKKTAAYTIDINGKIYQHYDPRYYSNVSTEKEFNAASIVVLLENEGWLINDNKKGGFINWVGDIYKRKDEVIEKKWRNHAFWAPYTKKQMESAVELSKMLCSDFQIPKIAIPSNTLVEDLDNYEGILYKSNLDRFVTDVNPSWDCKEFKNNLEHKLIENE